MPVAKRLLAALVILAVMTLGVAYITLHTTRKDAPQRPRAAGPAGKLRPRAAGPAGNLRPRAAGSAGKLTFDAGFDGTSLDTSAWATCYLWANPAAGCTNFGNDDETEWYLPSQDRVSAGILHLVAQRIPTLGHNRHGAAEEYSCRSGMVTSYPGLHFEYGYLQVVARIPRGAGLWPALWLVAVNGQWPPEIDILEQYGASGAAVYFHPVGAPKIGAHPATANLAAGWHTFGLSWTRSSLAWYIDGREVMFTSQRIPHEPMYLIADLADFKAPTSAGCAGALLLKSVELWQPLPRRASRPADSAMR